MIGMDANQIIDALGGTSVVARLFNIEPPSVSEWRAKNHIPQARLMYLRLLRPDVFSAVDAEMPPNSEEKRAA